MDPTHLFELIIAMFVAIIALYYLAQRPGLPSSVGLIVGGALLAFVPGLRAITVDPGLVLVIRRSDDPRESPPSSARLFALPALARHRRVRRAGPPASGTRRRRSHHPAPTPRAHTGFAQADC
jgi:hypothetical protein